MVQSYTDHPIQEHKSYDENNIFAKILRKEIPAAIIYEDEALLAFMDVMPQADGHILLIPKTPCRNLLDANPDILPHLIKTLQKLARAAQKAFNADGISIMQFNEAAGGQSVYHLHWHIIPRITGKALHPHGHTPADFSLLAKQAEKIRKALRDENNETLSAT